MPNPTVPECVFLYNLVCTPSLDLDIQNFSPTVTTFSTPTVARMNNTDYLSFCVCASMYPCFA